MKYPFAIFTAAAAAVSAIIRVMLGSDEPRFIESDEASPTPPITPRLVENYAQAGATNTEIADRFLVDESLIANGYRDVLRAARAMRRIAIRSYEFELAKKLNGPMLTWLGRNELGQSLNPSAPHEDTPSYGADELQ